MGKDDTLYAALSTLEALRCVLSFAATRVAEEPDQRRCVMINGVRRAYLYARARRDIYIEIPAEDPDGGPDVLGKLELCLYGTRDVAKGWQDTLSDQLVSCGFVRGVGHPSVFWHPERQIRTLVHGDDYVSGGMAEYLDWLQESVEEAYEIKTQKLGMLAGWEAEAKC